MHDVAKPSSRKKKGAAPAAAGDDAGIPPQEGANRTPDARETRGISGDPRGFFTRGVAAQQAVDETVLDRTMRLAMAAAGCANEAEFRQLPKQEQNAFLAQASGSQRPEAIAAEKEARRSLSVPTSQVVASYWNRKHFDAAKMAELTESVREHGVKQPAWVRLIEYRVTPPEITNSFWIEWRRGGQWVSVWLAIKKPSSKDYRWACLLTREDCAAAIAWLPKYELIAGERRWRAAAAAGRELPVIIEDATDEKAIELQALENLQREDPNPIETADKYAQLMAVYAARGLAKEAAVAEICLKLKVGRSNVYDTMKLLKLPEFARAMTLEGKLPPSHARELAKLEGNEKELLETTKMVLQKPKGRPERDDAREEGVLSFRETQRLVKERLQYLSNYAQWEKKVTEFNQAGHRVLTDKENEQHINGVENGYWYINHNSRNLFIRPDDTCSLPGASYRDYKQLWKKPPAPVLGRTPFGLAVTLHEKPLADEAVRAGGKLKREGGGGGGGGGSGGGKSAADLKREKEEKRKKIVFGLALEQIALAEAKAPGETEAFWRLVGPMVMPPYLNGDWKKVICRINGWDQEKFRMEDLQACMAEMSAPQIRALVLQSLVFTSCQYQHGGKALDAAAEFHKINLAEIGKSLEQVEESAGEFSTRIVQALAARPGEHLTPRDIASDINESSRSVLICLATRLKNNKRVQKVAPGLYTIAAGNPDVRTKGKR